MTEQEKAMVKWLFKGRFLLLMLVIGLIFSACARERVIDYESVRTKLRNFLALHTCEMIYKDVAYYGHQEKWLGLIETVNKRLLFSLQIKVRAGIDLKTADGANDLLRIEPVGKMPDDPLAPIQVRVTLPAASILLVDADEESLHEYFAIAKGADLTQTDWENQIARSRNRVEADALARGILVRAEENARAMVRNFLQIAGLEVVEFVRGEKPAEPKAEVIPEPKT